MYAREVDEPRVRVGRPFRAGSVSEGTPSLTFAARKAQRMDKTSIAGPKIERHTFLD
jgi:hypothetical protein